MIGWRLPSTKKGDPRTDLLLKRKQEQRQRRIADEIIEGLREAVEYEEWERGARGRCC